MTISFYQQMAVALRQGPLVLATIVQAGGSTPREVGAKMLVLEDGRIIGTVGGGAGEAKVIQQALPVWQTGVKQMVQIDLTGAPQRSTEGVCGGMMQVWLERWQGEAALRLVAAILELLQAGRGGTLVTPFDQIGDPYLLSEGELPTPMQAGCFYEVLLPPPTLLIVGAGHVAIPLATVASLAGFRVVVQDDRPEYAQAARFPTAAQVFAQPIETTMPQLEPIVDLYAALVTRGYQYDLAALHLLLQRPTRYIGMIGSRKRVRRVYQGLEEQGIPPTQLAQVYGPIGLDIGALTPEEIALSIGAELVMVRRGGTGRPLSGNG